MATLMPEDRPPPHALLPPLLALSSLQATCVRLPHAPVKTERTVSNPLPQVFTLTVAELTGR